MCLGTALRIGGNGGGTGEDVSSQPTTGLLSMSGSVGFLLRAVGSHRRVLSGGRAYSDGHVRVEGYGKMEAG